MILFYEEKDYKRTEFVVVSQISAMTETAHSLVLHIIGRPDPLVLEGFKGSDIVGGYGGVTQSFDALRKANQAEAARRAEQAVNPTPQAPLATQLAGNKIVKTPPGNIPRGLKKNDSRKA